jgi:hypothetical protein
VIDDLEPDQQITLVAPMWLGLGDYAIDEWEEALEEALSACNVVTADYVTTMPRVADSLEQGLNKHGNNRE